MKPTPPGWPRASSSLFYERASEAIDWLCKAFGFEVRLRVDGKDGKIMHSELVFGDAVFMVSDAPRADRPNTHAPTELGGANTQKVFVYVDDIDAHCARARAAGATIVSDVSTHDYGEEYWTDRAYGCTDIGRHEWYFAERVRTGSAKK
ncbi:MAG TPA: VOC family protein [Polyangiaceae bacterium]|nr:VOC family protein [Polyangiaceae bacterium]